MLGKRLNQKVCMVTDRKSCAQIKAKPELAEAKSPVVEALAHRTIPVAVTSEHMPLDGGCVTLSPVNDQ